MDEGTTRVPPASPLTKSKGDKTRVLESSRALPSVEKVVPRYLRASTGSCHDFCKHGKPEGYVSDTKNNQPCRRPVSSSGRDSLCAKENGVSVVSKKTVVVKPKPSADPKSESFGEETMDQEISSTSQNIDMHTEQASSNIKSDAREEAKTSNVAVTVESATLGTKDLSVSRKSSILTKVKPSSRSPSPIPPGSSHQSIDGRKSVDGSSTLSKAKSSSRLPSPNPLGSSVRRSIDGRSSVQASSTLSKAKPPSRSPSPITLGSSIQSKDGRKTFEGRKSIDKGKSVEGKETMDAEKGIHESVSTIPDSTHKSESNGEGSLSADDKKGSEGSTSLNSEGNKKDDTFGDGKIGAKSELSKKHVAASKPKMLKIKPQPSLIPTMSKPPSPSQPSNKTGDDNQVADKHSTSSLEEKKIGSTSGISTSSKPSGNGEEITDVEKVRVVRVVSSVRKPSKIIKVVAKGPNYQGLHEEDAAPADVIKTAPAKKSPASIQSKVASSKSLIPLAPGVPKSTVRSRISNMPSRLKILPTTSEEKITNKDASSSVLSRSKGVGLKSENQNTLKTRKATLVGETAQLNKRSVKIKVSTGANAVEKNNSDSFPLRRPSMRRKKNAQVLFNKVIEETASRLVRTSRSKVLALVGAFETVISIQKKSSTTPKAKRISSTRKPSH